MSDDLRHRLRDALPAALRARDRVAVAALRSALCAIDNAEAAEAIPVGTPPASAAIERSPVLGATEVARRELTLAQVERVVWGEVAEREVAADMYERAGECDRAAELRAEAAVLAAHLAN